MATWMGGEFGSEHTYMVESPHCSPETITTFLIKYIPVKNEKFKRFLKMDKLKLYY